MKGEGIVGLLVHHERRVLLGQTELGQHRWRRSSVVLQCLKLRVVKWICSREGRFGAEWRGHWLGEGF
jgi:hypothetical protein